MNKRKITRKKYDDFRNWIIHFYRDLIRGKDIPKDIKKMLS